MYELEVSRSFPAVHAISMRGERETPHEHEWRVTVVVAGPTLDGDGLLCDFHELQRALDAVVEPLRGSDLNETPPFDRTNPTAENVARHVGGRLEVPRGASLKSVTVTEAPGCRATWVAPQPQF